MKRAHMTEVKEEKLKESKGNTKIEDIGNEDAFKENNVGLSCKYCKKILTSRHSLNDHIKVKHQFMNHSEKFLCDVS